MTDLVCTQRLMPTPTPTPSLFEAVYACLHQVNTHIQTILPKRFECLLQTVEHTLYNNSKPTTTDHTTPRTTTNSTTPRTDVRTDVLRVAKRVREVCATVEQQMVDTCDILDIMAHTSDGLPTLDEVEQCVMTDVQYVPTTVGETFKYTDIPDSNSFYTAQLLALRNDGATMDIKHIGIDKKYGRSTIEVAEMQFVEWCPAYKRRKLEEGYCADVLFVL